MWLTHDSDYVTHTILINVAHPQFLIYVAHPRFLIYVAHPHDS
jgi:hypothetical protein